jgi:hypothetical protein
MIWKEKGIEGESIISKILNGYKLEAFERVFMGA